jgi:gliding motility-associated-like protein
MSSNIDVITDFRLLIFDRWGQEIFETKDPYEPWRGSYQNSGEILPAGVYAYKIDFEIKGTQARRELRGHVTLIR